MKMRCDASGFDGLKSYEPGVNDININHAKRLFVSKLGAVLDADENELDFATACAELGLNSQEIAQAKLMHEVV